MTNQEYKQKIMEERNDLEWLRNPDFWPHFPVQPLKRCNANGNFPECGTVSVDSKGVCVPTVYDCLFFASEANNCFEYESIEAMLADGWEVD